MPATFDRNAWPVLVVRIHGRDDDDAIVAMLEGLERHLSKGRCAVIFDTSETIYPSLAEAQRWTRQEGEWLRRNRRLIAEHCAGVGFVITNPAIRFILSGVLLISSLPCAHAVLSTSEEARAFCERVLREKRSSLIPTARTSASAPPDAPRRKSLGRDG